MFIYSARVVCIDIATCRDFGTIRAETALFILHTQVFASRNKCSEAQSISHSLRSPIISVLANMVSNKSPVLLFVISFTEFHDEPAEQQPP